MTEFQTLALALDQLGHEDRLHILWAANQNGPVSPKDVATDLDASLGGIAYHFRAMTDGGLLKLAKTRQVRGATQHFYRPTAAGRKLYSMLGGRA